MLATPLLAVLVAAPAPAQDAHALDGSRWAQLTIHEHVVIRIPRVAPPQHGRRRAEPRRDLIGDEGVTWVEHHAGRCLATQSVVAAAISAGDSVDLFTDDGQRLRARLDEDCPALDFYSGVYLRPAADGRLCAKRDAIRSRSGAVCPIREFRRLVPR